MGKLHTGIFGPSLSGKTELAKHISRQLADRHNIPSLVLDPIASDWGPHARVFTREEQVLFWNEVWTVKRHAVFVDEGTEMINRDDTLTPAFTRIRHQQHKLYVIGHRGSSLLPVMRDQISELFLFRQSPKSANIWAEQFADERIHKATELNEYEFLWVQLYQRGELVPMKLNLRKNAKIQESSRQSA